MPEYEDESGRLQEMAQVGTRRYGAGERLAIGAASAPQTAAFANNIDEVLLHASSRCFVLVGATPVATAVVGIPLEAGEKFHLQIRNGEKIAVIRDTADGWLNIVPVI